MPQQVSMSFTFTVIGALTVNSPAPPAATQNQAYSHQFAATGGTAPYSWALTAGSLPAGLTLSGSGLLSGTPTVSGDFPVTITVTDSTP